MKRILLFIVLLLFPFVLVNAEVTTYERTDDNLRVPEKIKYKKSMYYNVIDTPSVNAEEKVYDFAGLLTEEQIGMLKELITSYIKQTYLDIAVVTVENHHKNSTMEYADDFYDYNDFKINGSVLVIDMSFREFYISTAGTGLMYYSNDRVESILSSIDYSMISGNYYEAMTTFIDRSLAYFNTGMVESEYVVVDGIVYHKTPYQTLCGITAVITAIIFLPVFLAHKRIKLATDSNYYLNQQQSKITRSETKFLYSHTKKTYIPPVDSGGGSGGGGGFHSGSSGMSHGGGGHHF